jgi:hypothetical protein
MYALTEELARAHVRELHRVAEQPSGTAREHSRWRRRVGGFARRHRAA